MKYAERSQKSPCVPFEAEQLRELRARQVERQPRFEADEDGFGKESDRIAGANQPCRNRDEGHEQRRARGKRGVARGISSAQFAHRRDNRATTMRRWSVTTVCFELQKTQKTSPEKRQA